MTGRDGEDLIIKVPVGTVIKNMETNKIIADLDEEGKSIVIAKEEEVVLEIRILQLLQIRHQDMRNQGKKARNYG